MNKLIFNNINPDTKRKLIEIVDEMVHKELIEGLILGGTELPLI
ncbi:MAG: aspartate/glutamate racemase family protein [Bacteroidetes bacterium]|nr:aspartate/glutamate racemase family protein [Bacteroidota bacterium]MBU1579350.1 aspartate/glutamate racemase family protein [Bacteroidota bacterium]